MQLVVVWRDKKRPLETSQRGKDDNNNNSTNTAGPRGPAGEELDVIVELCKTDVDSVQLQVCSAPPLPPVLPDGEQI